MSEMNPFCPVKLKGLPQKIHYYLCYITEYTRLYYNKPFYFLNIHP
jgi:hypothetical protein